MYKYSIKEHYKLYITVFIAGLLFVTTLISVGFSALNQNLNISGDIDYDEHSSLLYDVLKREAKLGTYATEYTGSHQDSMAGIGAEKIYHWEADNNTEASTIRDKWNVLFGGFCWQMIRTTDTGGIKLIYRGVPSNGQCKTGIARIGTSAFNSRANSLAYVGYMYNTVYTDNSKSPTSSNVLTSLSMSGSTNYYYGTDVTYSNGIYTLTDITQGTWSSKYSRASGLYTCRSATETTCSTVYYIVEGTSSYMYGFSMTGGNLLNYYNTNLTLGTAYTENNGLYTLTDTTTISRIDWFNDYSNYKYYYTCGDDQTTCSNIKYITYPSAAVYYAISSSNNYVYGKDFTYNSGTNTYTLSSDRYQSWNMTANDRTYLATHHYTCFNDTGECTTLSYVYNASINNNSPYIYYIRLTNGKSIEDAINAMLFADNVNQTNSTIKTKIDNWYASNMTSYTSYLEDTIFCNDRSQSNQSSNGWNPDGGSITIYMQFRNYNLNSDLSCTNDTDKFSVSNNKAKLTYPVGLLTCPEANLLNNNNLRQGYMSYWLISPDKFGAERYVYDGGYLDRYYGITETMDVRPSVSLKPGTEYTSGTGTMADPYIVQ